MPHPRPGTAVTAGRDRHGQMPTGHKSSSQAARADGRDAQNRKIWRKVHSISAGLDSRKYSAICANCNQLITDCSLHSVIIACRRPIVKDSLTAARLLSRANEPSFLSLNRPRRTSSATQLSPIRRWISGRAWCDGPIPARARRDAVCCSVRCRQARHRFVRTAGLRLGRKTLAGYQEQGPSLSSHPALVRSTGSVEPEISGVIATREDHLRGCLARLRAGRWQSHSICTQWKGGRDRAGKQQRHPGSSLLTGCNHLPGRAAGEE